MLITMGILDGYVFWLTLDHITKQHSSIPGKYQSEFIKQAIMRTYSVMQLELAVVSNSKSNHK